jgi:WD40 repeat protein
MNHLSRITYALLIGILLTACSGKLSSGAPTPAATDLSQSSTPLPSNLSTISLDNAAQVTLLTRWEIGNATQVDWAPDGSQLGVSSSVGIHLYQVATQQETQFIKTDTAVSSLAFSPDGKTLASGAEDGTVRLWSLPDVSLLHILKEHTKRTNSLDFSPDGQLLASGSDDGTARLWKVAGGTLQLTIDKYGGIGFISEVNGVAFSPDGQKLATALKDGSLQLWRVSDGRLLRYLAGHQLWVESVAYSPDGQLLASGSDDHTARLWRAADGSLLRTLEGHTKSVFSVAFSPDGQVLASGSGDGTLRLWRVSDGTLLRTLDGQAGPVVSVSFSPDGQLLASASSDGAISLWGSAP